MSNFLAIATVTATLSQIVREAARVAVSGADIRNVRPDSIVTGDLDTPFVNVFLYQVGLNGAYRNMDVPTRGPDGALVQRPRAALDLHYLLSFYGAEGQLVPQRIMGSVLGALHTEPVLSRKRIRDTVAAFGFLGTSDLADEIEQVKFTNLGLSLEEIFKLWSAFHQSTYVPSTAFLASVVLIDGSGAPQSAVPVRTRTVTAVPFQYPRIDQVDPQFVVAAPGTRIRLRGSNLSADTVTVRFGELEQTPDPPFTPTLLTVALPSGLSAGVNTVQVKHWLLLGVPALPHPGNESNLAAFVVRPQLTSVTFSAPLDSNGQPVPTITVVFTPPAGTDQEVDLLLNELTPPAGHLPRAFRYSSPGRAAATGSVDFVVRGLPSTTYLARVRVAGGESELQVQTDQSQPDFNQYVGPTVVVP